MDCKGNHDSLRHSARLARVLTACIFYVAWKTLRTESLLLIYYKGQPRDIITFANGTVLFIFLELVEDVEDDSMDIEDNIVAQQRSSSCREIQATAIPAE